MPKAIPSAADEVVNRAEQADTCFFAMVRAENETNPVPKKYERQVEALVRQAEDQFQKRTSERNVEAPVDQMRARYDKEVVLLGKELDDLPVMNMGPIEAASEDPLQAATRSARRNLAATWGTVLFVLAATAFEPGKVSLAGVEFVVGVPLAVALTGLLAYHGFTFWSYAYSENAKPRQRLQTLRQEIALSRARLANVRQRWKCVERGTYAHTPRIDAQMLKAGLERWQRAAEAQIAQADVAADRVRRRFFWDYELPLIGGPVAFVAMWGSIIAGLTVPSPTVWWEALNLGLLVGVSVGYLYGLIASG